MLRQCLLAIVLFVTVGCSTPPNSYNPKEALADLLLHAASQGIHDPGYIPVQEIAKSGTDKSAIGVYATGRNDEICQGDQYGKSNCWIDSTTQNQSGV